ncbi:RNA polymerase recycling motor HelD [Planococcus shixiaomingii]|uniref:RNA polymerase recycling motor HelD n=1 Tax=Planococcus shixiaomingii TaxID=3058393 RepID=UPI002638DD5A|nr:RNA polymerase recycling motor HelD [Planococcus sp. N022]WKA54512.1 RNA polymerase recycling motor HelD [Planococcus sp. N022]
MDPEFQREQKRVDRVMKEIAVQMERLENDTSRQRDEVVRIRRHFWDENKVSIDSFDDFLETIIGLRQEAQALSATESIHKQSAKKLTELRGLQKTPYFGRIDFIEEGQPAKEAIYIGISTLTDASGEEFLVYDWRAPVSSVYYDYQPGLAEYATPGGTVKGRLEKKWQYQIRGGVLQSMFDTSLTIGDEILQQVLGKSADKQMRSIVATIQQEQNRIIRHDRTRLLIVHGAAGSGKTSAALQRIAYLLYKYRDRLNADQIILFSPNAMFSHYVSNVLPELGEENMQQVTFQDYLHHRLSAQFEIENPYGQLEYALTATDEPAYKARMAGIRFKASVYFFEAIKSYRKALEKSGMRFKGMSFRGEPIVSAKQVEERFYTSDTSLRFYSRLEKLRDWLLRQLNEVEQLEWKEPWVEEAIELLSNDDYSKAQAYLAKKSGLKRKATADYEMDPKDLARLVVHQKLKPLRKKIRAFGFVDIKGIYRQLFEGSLETSERLPLEWADICRSTLDRLDEKKLFYEDATPFLLMKELILGFQTNSSIKHIVVDEAQDYSPFQFEFLKRLFPAAKMTVLGDFNQAIFAHTDGIGDFGVLTSLYGPEETEVIDLVRSYRATKPIIEFTRMLIPGGERIIPFEREGERPVLTQAADHAELHRRIADKVADLRSKSYGSIAIICKSAAESARAYGALSGIEGIKQLKSGSAEYQQGVVVLPSYLAKGIEFDAVILYDASAQVYGEESLRRIFYTACTRAMHELQIYCVGEPSPFLVEASRNKLVQT